MILTNENVEQVIKGNNRMYSSAIVFSFLSCKTPESIFIQAPNAQTGCVPDQIVFPYLYHLQDRLFIKEKVKKRVFPSPQNYFIDGRLHGVKRKPYSHIGYVGKKADKNGNVNDKITLYIPRTEIKKITLRTNFDRIIKEATIIAKTKTGQEITRYEITDNEKSELVIDMPAENVGVLELHIKKHTPNKRIWLISFYPGFEFFVDEKNIIKIKHQKKKTENKQGSIGRLYINSIDLELNNITRIYDEQNAESPIAGFFNSNVILNVAIFLEHKKLEKTFSLKFGTYFVTEIKTSEEKPTVKIKAQDYIGLNKDIFLSLGILENTNAYECFGKIAQALNMSAHLDKNLQSLTLKRIPLNGTVSKLLNKLCILTNSFCTSDITGVKLFATNILERHANTRYPVRYFFLDEYKGAAGDSTTGFSPNIINLSYTTYEYEGEYQAGRRESILYANMEQRAFPDNYKNTPFGDYPIGAGEVPSISRDYYLSENFITIEFSDPLIPRCLEYDVKYEYDENGKPVKAHVSVWNFIDRNEGEQFTIVQMIMEKPYARLLKKEEFLVPKRPREYIVPEKDPNLNEADFFAVEHRNSMNRPEIVKIEIKDNSQIERVEVANRFLQSRFEFVYEKTNEGISVKVWNYYKENPQTLTVNIYGSRLVEGREKKTIQARNEDDIRINGEIVKNISVGALASDDVARDVLQTMSMYYHKFSKDFSTKIWSDPRLELYDLIAFKSLRGYGFTQGIIDEIEYEYKGYLTQKLKIKQTTKHNRDCRMWCGYVPDDRPVLAKTFLKYA